jgi:hypothetical protein
MPTGGAVTINKTENIISNSKIVNDIKNISWIFNSTEPTVLWRVGTYTENGVRFSFPSSQNSPRTDNIYFSEIDFNSKRFDYFRKKRVKVILLVEPGDIQPEKLIVNVLNYANSYDNIIGFCIDYGSNLFSKPTKSEISRLLKLVKGTNNKYFLSIKHWDINQLPYISDPSLMYIYSNPLSNNIDEFTKSSYVWYKKYFPSKIGFEVTNEYFLENYSLKIIKKSFKDKGILNYSIFFSQELFDIIK